MFLDYNPLSSRNGHLLISPSDRQESQSNKMAWTIDSRFQPERTELGKSQEPRHCRTIEQSNIVIQGKAQSAQITGKESDVDLVDQHIYLQSAKNRKNCSCALGISSL
jgi:hypothetical protein